MSVEDSNDGEDGPGDKESVLMCFVWGPGEIADYTHKIGIKEGAHENKWKGGL